MRKVALGSLLLEYKGARKMKKYEIIPLKDIKDKDGATHPAPRPDTDYEELKIIPKAPILFPKPEIILECGPELNDCEFCSLWPACVRY